MLRPQRLLRALPFEPMSLSTFETMKRLSAASSSSPSGPPYFISPKHDGVRIVSYVSERADQQKWTCFSRFGRPVHGMFWIEDELRVLRWLSGDARLVLDGELYIHRERPDGGGAATRTGFLAVSALVHRLRGARSTCVSEADVLQYVDSLPRFCVFDVVSYQPPADGAGREGGGRGLSRLARERLLLLRGAMAQCNVRDLEMLRVVPNHAIFSQRLKTMHFLMCLLQRARASPLLFPAGERREPQGPQGTQGQQGPQGTQAGIGGAYVQLIPHTMTRSLTDARRVHLRRFVAQGYEGAVVRSAANVYEAREKVRGTLRALLAPPPAAALAPPLLLHTYAADGAATAAAGDAEDAADERSVVDAAVRSARGVARRSQSAAKLLPFRDAEYAILRPLLKAPSSNPRARRLLHVPASATTGQEGGVFYGLQCLSESGRTFNVALPKMDEARQRELLEHLLHATGGATGGRRSLTGLYVTVKFASLTEYGVPRFGQVKAIRGAKGWFM